MFSSVTILVSTKLTTVTPSMVSRRRWRREACDIGQTPVQDRNRTLTGAGRRVMINAGPRAGLAGVGPSGRTNGHPTEAGSLITLYTYHNTARNQGCTRSKGLFHLNLGLTDAG